MLRFRRALHARRYDGFRRGRLRGILPLSPDQRLGRGRWMTGQKQLCDSCPLPAGDREIIQLVRASRRRRFAGTPHHNSPRLTCTARGDVTRCSCFEPALAAVSASRFNADCRNSGPQCHPDRCSDATVEKGLEAIKARLGRMVEKDELTKAEQEAALA